MLILDFVKVWSHCSFHCSLMEGSDLHGVPELLNCIVQSNQRVDTFKVKLQNTVNVILILI